MKKRKLLALSMAMMLLCPAFGSVAKAMDPDEKNKKSARGSKDLERLMRDPEWRWALSMNQMAPNDIRRSPEYLRRLREWLERRDGTPYTSIFEGLSVDDDDDDDSESGQVSSEEPAGDARANVSVSDDDDDDGLSRPSADCSPLISDPACELYSDSDDENDEFDPTKSCLETADGRIIPSWKVHYSGDSSVRVNGSDSEDDDDDFDSTRSGRFSPPVRVNDGVSDDDDDDEDLCVPTESPKKDEGDPDDDNDDEFDPTKSCLETADGRIIPSWKVHYSGDSSVRVNGSDSEDDDDDTESPKKDKGESDSDNDDDKFDPMRSGRLSSSGRFALRFGLRGIKVSVNSSVSNDDGDKETGSKPAEKPATKKEKEKPVAKSKPAKKVAVRRKEAPVPEAAIRRAVPNERRLEYHIVYAMPIFAGISGERRFIGEKINAAYTVEEPRQGCKNQKIHVYIQFVKKPGVNSVTVGDYVKVVKAILEGIQ